MHTPRGYTSMPVLRLEMLLVGALLTASSAAGLFWLLAQ